MAFSAFLTASSAADLTAGISAVAELTSLLTFSEVPLFQIASISLPLYKRPYMVSVT
ncbi:hypothetical protein [Limosilactobacillus vaginalis]|uniref:hypothetical protein n=1 Tax=Limosilactobacillus vaginalis TaxID=1633 RepID=UPI0022E096A6|nr:hypothetical protein [Limosilactobacillus vaginalis]